MQVLVTGGTGFTGSHLVKRLLERGHQVRVLDNQLGLCHDELVEAGAEIHLGCVTDAEVVDTLVKDCEVVYHVAASFRRLNDSRRHYANVNVDGTRTVAEAAHRWNVRRFVYCSTCGVHGKIDLPPADEDAPIAPEDYYQRTKFEGELVVREYARRGLSSVCLRPAAIYGPGDPGRFLHLFRLASRGVFPMFGNGQVLYHPLHVSNLLDAFELAATAESDDGSAYLIADDRFWTLDELVTHVARALDVPLRIRHFPYFPIWCAAVACEAACKPFRLSPPLFRRRVSWFRHNRAFCIDRARSELGYEPRVGLSQGLEQTATWYRENGFI